MENFYVTYDATNSEQLRIGLSSNEAEATVFSNLVLWICLLLAGMLVVVFAILFICFCCRTRQQARLARAKTYFDQLKEKNSEDPEAKFLDEHNTAVNAAKKGNKKKNKEEADEEDEKLKTFNPNSFISSKSFDEEDDGDEVSSQEARDQVPALTNNEQAVGELLM